MRTRRWIFFACYGASGAAALIYQVAWVRLFTLTLGHTAAASSTVLAAFMGGLSLGAWAAGRLRLEQSRNLRSYAALELFIAAIAVALPTVFSAIRALDGVCIRGRHQPCQFRDRSRRGKPDPAWRSRGSDGSDLPDRGRVARPPPGCAVAGSAHAGRDRRRRALFREHRGCCRRSDCRGVLAHPLIRHSRDDVDWSLSEHCGGLRGTVARSRSASLRSCAHDTAPRPANGASPAHVHTAPLARSGGRRRLRVCRPGLRSRLDAASRVDYWADHVCVRLDGCLIYLGYRPGIEPRRPPRTTELECDPVAGSNAYRSLPSLLFWPPGSPPLDYRSSSLIR